MKLLLIFNPNAANRRARRQLPLITKYLEDRSVTVEIKLTRQPGDGTVIAADSNLSAYDGIIAAGGDGTLFEVLNGIYKHPAEGRAPLGVIPLGTGNAFSRDLGLEPGQWQRAVELIRRRNIQLVDVGHMVSSDREYYFLNIVGMGFATDAGLTAKKLKFLGNSAYTLATLWRVLGLKSYPLQIELDGELIRQDNVFVEVSNSRYTGTRFLIAPDALSDDGLLDITLLRRLSRWRLLRLFPTIYSGRHIEFGEVASYKARRIRIISPAGMLLAPDGEFSGTTPAEIRCLHRDLAIFSN